MPGRVSWADVETKHVYGSSTMSLAVGITTSAKVNAKGASVVSPTATLTTVGRVSAKAASSQALIATLTTIGTGSAATGPVSGRVSWADVETKHVYGVSAVAITASLTTTSKATGRGRVSWAEVELGVGGGAAGVVSTDISASITTTGKVAARGAVVLPLVLGLITKPPRILRIAAAGLVWLFGDSQPSPVAHGQSVLDLVVTTTTSGKVTARGQTTLDLFLDAVTGGRPDLVHGSVSLPLSLALTTGPRLSTSGLGLYESLLAADRPLAWWGLDSQRPTHDDSGHGRTLTAVGTPTGSYSLIPRGDNGISGSRDFGGTDAYVAPGTLYQDPVGPPQFHAATAGAGNTAETPVISPADVEAGDLQIVCLAHPTQTATITAPAGWTLVGIQNATTCAFSVWKRVPSTDEPPTEWVWTWSVVGATIGVMLVYRNCNPAVADLIFAQAFGLTASGSQHATAAVSYPLQAHQLALWIAETAATITPNPTGVTSRVDASVGDVHVVAAEYDKATAGSAIATASTSAALGLGYCVVTFGAPQTVVDESLDVLSETISLHAVYSPTTLVGQNTLIRKHGSWGLQTNGSVLEFQYTDSLGAVRTITGPTMSIGNVHHLVVTDDGANVNFWHNGEKTSYARPGAAGYTTNSEPVVIGARFISPNYDLFLDGRLDEVAIWNKPLSDEMVDTYWTAFSQGTFGQFLQPVSVGDPIYPRAKLEIAWASAPTDDCLVWTDVTSDLRSAEPISPTRGRNFELDRFEPGRIDFTLTNRDRQYDPSSNPAIVPTRAIRLRAQADVDGACYGIFFGYTEGHPLQYPAVGYDATARFTAIDPFKALALDQVLGQFVRPQELSGARLAALLDGFPGIPFSGETGQSEVVADDLAGANSLDHAQQVAETEGGVLFCDASGTVVFQDRHHRSRETVVRATYGDGGFKLRDMQPLIDEARLFTAASVTPASGNVKTAVDIVQSAEHFLRTKQVTTLHADDADAQAMAEAYAIRYATPRMRVPSLDVLPAGDATPRLAWDAVLSHEVSQRIRSAITPVGDTTSIMREHFVEGVRHSISRESWTVSLSVSPAELEGEYAIVGTARTDTPSGPTSSRVGW